MYFIKGKSNFKRISCIASIFLNIYEIFAGKNLKKNQNLTDSHLNVSCWWFLFKNKKFILVTLTDFLSRC